jgi:hypothetical protein
VTDGQIKTDTSGGYEHCYPTPLAGLGTARQAWTKPLRAVPLETVRFAAKRPLLAIAKGLNHDAIPDDCGVAVAHGIPHTSKRIDVLLSGRDEAGRHNLLIVELKVLTALALMCLLIAQ